jgi:ABC-type nitrate/sulfonate/bicarbonate transport system substrate-binding protein
MNTKLVALAAVAIIVITAIGTALLLQPQDEEMSVSVAYSEKVNYETLMVANANGYFRDEGADVDVKLVTGGIEAATALITGAVDLAAMGDAPAVQLISQDQGAKIVARLVGGKGMHRFIAWNDIQEPKDLEGKKLGIQQTSSTHGAFLQWAEANDVNVNNITFLYLNPRDIPLAMQSRQIDAMGGSEPWAVNTENLCGDDVHELGNSSGLGSTFPIVLVASERALDDKPEAIKAVLKALDRGNEFIKSNWTEALEICAGRTGLTMDDQSRCSGFQFYELGFNGTDVESMNMTARSMMDFGKISQMPDVMAHVDLTLMPRDGEA